MWIHRSAAAALFALPASALFAQTAPANIPIRPLGAVTAVSKDTIGPLVVVRELSNGGVLLNDQFRRRVILFDADLRKSSVVLDSVGANGNAPVASGLLSSRSLIRYTGDSTLYVDIASQSLLVLDVNGKVARVMALPRPKDAMYVAGGTTYGMPSIDPKGRLVYRGVVPPKPFRMPAPGEKLVMPTYEQPDSAPIVRADFDTRTIDTVTTLKQRIVSKLVIDQGAQGNAHTKSVMNPMPTGDEWAMLSDGTVAVVRVHDYHIDWVDPDGTHRSTPKMPFDWKRLTDAEKQAKVDSMRTMFDKMNAAAEARAAAAGTAQRTRLTIDVSPASELDDYEPPISYGSVKADLAGNLWIVPRTSASAQGGLLYDVVNRQGEITHRVQFPKGYSLAGFGEGGVAYVLHMEGTAYFLARAKLP